MQRFGLGVDLRHGAGQFGVDFVVNVDDAVVAVLAVEAAFFRLVAMLKPVVADEVRALQAPRDEILVGGGAVGLGLDAFATALAVGQADILAAEGEFANDQRFAEHGIARNGLAGIEAITIERDAIDVLRRGGHDGLRRDVGETRAELYVVGVLSLDGFGGDAEVAFREAREECVAIGDEGRAFGVGFVGLALGFLVLPVNGLALVRLFDGNGFRDRSEEHT